MHMKSENKIIKEHDGGVSAIFIASQSAFFFSNSNKIHVFH